LTVTEQDLVGSQAWFSADNKLTNLSPENTES